MNKYTRYTSAALVLAAALAGTADAAPVTPRDRDPVTVRAGERLHEAGRLLSGVSCPVGVMSLRGSPDAGGLDRLTLRVTERVGVLRDVCRLTDREAGRVLSLRPAPRELDARVRLAGLVFNQSGRPSVVPVTLLPAVSA